MFTRIRGSPYSGGDGQWIAAGYQNQFGQEVQVIAFICLSFSAFFYLRICFDPNLTDGLLAFSFLMLILVIPYQSSPQRQRLQVYLWTGVIMIIYSVLVSLFRVKNRGEFALRSLDLELKCVSRRVSLQTILIDKRLFGSLTCAIISLMMPRSYKCRFVILKKMLVYSFKLSLLLLLKNINITTTNITFRSLRLWSSRRGAVWHQPCSCRCTWCRVWRWNQV